MVADSSGPFSQGQATSRAVSLFRRRAKVTTCNEGFLLRSMLLKVEFGKHAVCLFFFVFKPRSNYVSQLAPKRQPPTAPSVSWFTAAAAVAAPATAWWAAMRVSRFKFRRLDCISASPCFLMALPFEPGSFAFCALPSPFGKSAPSPITRAINLRGMLLT